MPETKPRYEDVVGKRGLKGILTIEDLLEIHPNRYVITEVVAQRAHHLNAGMDEPRVDLGINPRTNEPLTAMDIGYVQVAIAEVLAGMVKPRLPTAAGGPSPVEFPEDFEKIPDAEI